MTGLILAAAAVVVEVAVAVMLCIFVRVVSV
jgi:hypothetical protein